MAREDAMRGPAHVILSMSADGAPQALRDIRLLVRGQGTIGFAVAGREPFGIGVASTDDGGPEFRWEIGEDAAVLRERIDGSWIERCVVSGAGIDPDTRCQYWFSFDSHNRALRYGKGEMRLGCQLGAFELPPKPEPAEPPVPDPYQWFCEAQSVMLDANPAGDVGIWRDPVTVEPPMWVVPHNRITMDQMAQGKVTVPANLTPTCQVLYDNVAGDSFQLDTPDFPHFAQAIKESIADPNGWCHKTLDHKATEFGDRDELKTYLRITLGQNQGDSPGIPFVLEIWPVGHYSPVHNHGGSDAVIKVLHGAITVDLYPMLSKYHRTPFATKTFDTGAVTWVSERLNQVHKLINLDRAEPCITIQCYMYAENNLTHWPYFDYLKEDDIALFAPNSDADFLTFKQLMRDEWETRHGPV